MHSILQLHVLVPGSHPDPYRSSGRGGTSAVHPKYAAPSPGGLQGRGLARVPSRPDSKTSPCPTRQHWLGCCCVPLNPSQLHVPGMRCQTPPLWQKSWRTPTGLSPNGTVVISILTAPSLGRLVGSCLTIAVVRLVGRSSIQLKGSWHSFYGRLQRSAAGKATMVAPLRLTITASTMLHSFWPYEPHSRWLSLRP